MATSQRNAILLVTVCSRLFIASGTGAQTITPIADIQANPSAYDGHVVTIQGQVYIPANYRAPVYAGFVQDGSGRGISVFGSNANNPALFDVGNIVRLTGTIDIFFTTVEIEFLTEVTLISGGNPPLVPQVLSTGAAMNSAWEGTYIQVTGPITNKVSNSGGGVNYTVNDGTGNIVIRVMYTLGAPDFNIGTRITARGAGSRFQSTYQILVGRTMDVFEDVIPIEESSWGSLKLRFKMH